MSPQAWLLPPPAGTAQAGISPVPCPSVPAFAVRWLYHFVALSSSLRGGSRSGPRATPSRRAALDTRRLLASGKERAGRTDRLGAGCLGGGYGLATPLRRPLGLPCGKPEVGGGKLRARKWAGKGPGSDMESLAPQTADLSSSCTL